MRKLGRPFLFCIYYLLFLALVPVPAPVPVFNREFLTDLTTVFTPPASCSSSWTYEGEYYNSVKGGLLIQNAISVETACFPTGFKAFGRTPPFPQVYNPGWCPEGYSSPAVFPGESLTTAACCPSNYDYYSTLSTIDGGYSSTVLFQGCTSMLPSSSTTAVPERTKKTNLSPGTVTGPITMWAQPITVAYQSSDVSLYTTSTTSTGASTPTAEPNARITTDYATSTSTSDPNSQQQLSSGLSTGAKAGIGVGAAAGAVLIIAIITSLLFWRLRKRAQQKAMSQNQLNPTPFVHEVQSYPKAQIGPPQELATSYHNNPAGNGPRFELEA